MKVQDILHLSTLPPFLLVNSEGVVQSFNEPARLSASRLFTQPLKTGSSVYSLLEPLAATQLKEFIVLAMQGQTGRFYVREKQQTVGGYEITCEPYSDRESVFLTFNLTGTNRPVENLQQDNLNPATENHHYRPGQSLPPTMIYTDGQGVVTRIINLSEIEPDFELDQLVGHKIQELLKALPEAVTAWEEALRGEKFQPAVLKSGKQVFECYIAPIFNSAGVPEGTVAISINVTEKQKALEELHKSERLYRTLSERFPYGTISVFDTELRFINAGGEGLKNSTFVREQMLGKHIREVLPPAHAEEIETLYRQTLAGNEIEKKEMVVGDFTYDLLLWPLKDEQDEIYAGIAVAYNITERKKAEKALKATELIMHAAIESIAEHFYLLGTDYKILLFNKRAKGLVKQMSGIDLEEGLYFPDLVGPKLHTALFEHLERTLKGESFSIELLMGFDNGIEYWVEIHHSPVIDENGQVTAICLTFLNISHRKVDDKALRTSEAMLRAILDNLQQSVYLVDPDYKIKLFNRRAAELVPVRMGFELTSGEDFRKLVQSGNLPEFYQTFKRALAGENISQELRLQSSRNGVIVWSEVRYNPVIEDRGEISGVCISMLNITTRKQAEEALRISENLLRTTLDNMQQSFFLLDKDGILLLFNAVAEKKFKDSFNRALVIGQSLKDQLPPQFHTQYNAGLATVLSGQPLRLELELPDGAGGKYWAEGMANPVFNENGQIATICLTTLDITERMGAEQALRTSEARLRAIMDNTSQFFFLLDLDLNIQAFNRAVADFFLNERNLKVETGRSIQEYIMTEYQGELGNYLISAGRGQDTTTEFTTVYTDGRTYHWQGWASPVRDQDGIISGICVTLMDISRRKQDEQKIKAALVEKEVLLKEIHHRVKNNLQIISSLLKLQGSSIQEPEVQTVLNDSQQRIRSIALIHEMLYRTGNLSLVDFSEYLKNLGIQLMKTYRKGSVELIQTGPKGIWLGLDQAIPCGLIMSELFTNALKYAFPPDFNRRATIKITTEVDNQAREFSLEVADNGVGIPAGFELDQVDTLGYQLVNMLSRQLDGQLTIESNPLSGTTVRLKFAIKE